MVEVPERIRHELYCLPPEAFIGKRDERAAQAREQGDTELASVIRNLRRPTTAAWAVNLLSTHEPERLRALLDIGHRLRSARSTGQGSEIRRGDQERADLTRILVERATELAAGSGRSLNPAMRDQVQETLNAAVADMDIAVLVRDGTLTKPLTYSGFGPDSSSPSPALRDSGSGRPQSHQDTGEQKRALREAREVSDRTERTLRQAEQELHHARSEQDRAAQRRDQARDELDRCERETREADAAVHAAQGKRDQAAEEHSSARELAETLTQRR